MGLALLGFFNFGAGFFRRIALLFPRFGLLAVQGFDFGKPGHLVFGLPDGGLDLPDRGVSLDCSLIQPLGLEGFHPESQLFHGGLFSVFDVGFLMKRHALFFLFWEVVFALSA
jgi:hypothetical protein